CVGVQCFSIAVLEQQMNPEIFAWTIFGIYLLGTAIIALFGSRKTKDFRSYALGNRDMHPALVGVAWATSMASTLTFVINPGFVYAFGLSAFISLSIPLVLGMGLGLVLLSRRFQDSGIESNALTLPHWIGLRFKSPAFQRVFSSMALLNVFYVVLIVVASAYVMQNALSISYTLSLVIIIGFVFSYTLFGGTYAHTFTNMFQGVLMVAVTLMIAWSGRHFFANGVDGFIEMICARNAVLMGFTNPESPFYATHFEVLICTFVIGFALVAQPHLLTKTLYLRKREDLHTFIWTGLLTYASFTIILLGGFYAILTLKPGLNPDAALSYYIVSVFPPALATFISVAILAAAMSTLDGILVAVSAIVAFDLFRNWMAPALLHITDEDRLNRLAMRASKVIIIGMGIGAFFLSLNPPKFVGIFASIGLYGILAASVGPILGGLFLRNLKVWVAFVGSSLGLFVHLALYYGGYSPNTAKTATISTFINVAFIFAASWFTPKMSQQPTKFRRTCARSDLR
ncbi:MAG: hypothetical protein ACE5IY_23195, partial [bacterium]